MRTIEVSGDIAAPRSAVWDVLADFPNIAAWNGGVKKSFATGASVEGVGATRHCDLAPFGQLEETVTEWTPHERMVVNIDSARRLPIASGVATFDLVGGGDTTTTSIRYDYEAKFGMLGSLIGPLLDRQLTKGFAVFLDDLETAARAGG